MSPENQKVLASWGQGAAQPGGDRPWGPKDHGARPRGDGHACGGGPCYSQLLQAQSGVDVWKLGGGAEERTDTIPNTGTGTPTHWLG